MHEQRYLYLLRRYRALGKAKNLDFSGTVEVIYQMRLATIEAEVTDASLKLSFIKAATAQRDREFSKFAGAVRQAGRTGIPPIG